MLKKTVKEKGKPHSPTCMEGGSPTPPAKPEGLLNAAAPLLFIEICVFRMGFNLSKVFASDS